MVRWCDGAMVRWCDGEMLKNGEGSEPFETTEQLGRSPAGAKRVGRSQKLKS